MVSIPGVNIGNAGVYYKISHTWSKSNTLEITVKSCALDPKRHDHWLPPVATFPAASFVNPVNCCFSSHRPERRMGVFEAWCKVQ